MKSTHNLEPIGCSSVCQNSSCSRSILFLVILSQFDSIVLLLHSYSHFTPLVPSIIQSIRKTGNHQECSSSSFDIDSQLPLLPFLAQYERWNYYIFSFPWELSLPLLARLHYDQQLYIYALISIMLSLCGCLLAITCDDSSTYWLWIRENYLLHLKIRNLLAWMKINNIPINGIFERCMQ